MFSVGEDGALFMFKVADKEGRGLKRDKEIVFSEEILITKSDLEEKVCTYVRMYICMHIWLPRMGH